MEGVTLPRSCDTSAPLQPSEYCPQMPVVPSYLRTTRHYSSTSTYSPPPLPPIEDTSWNQYWTGEYLNFVYLNDAYWLTLPPVTWSALPGTCKKEVAPPLLSGGSPLPGPSHRSGMIRRTSPLLNWLGGVTHPTSPFILPPPRFFHLQHSAWLAAKQAGGKPKTVKKPYRYAARAQVEGGPSSSGEVEQKDVMEGAIDNLERLLEEGLLEGFTSKYIVKSIWKCHVAMWIELKVHQDWVYKSLNFKFW